MAKLKIQTIKDGKDKNRFCGPSVISALTDLTTGEAARLIRLQTGARKVTGTDTREVRQALLACNISMSACHYPGLSRTTGPTLAAWLRMSKEDRTPGRIFLIVAGWHWQIVSGRRYTCGRVRDIVSIRDKRVKRRARVAEVYELTSDNVTRPNIDVTKPKPKPNPDYYQIKKMIKQNPDFGITYQKDDIEYWVTMSSELEELAADMWHPLADEHSCYSIGGVRKRIEEMVAFGNEHCAKMTRDN